MDNLSKRRIVRMAAAAGALFFLAVLLPSFLHPPVQKATRLPLPISLGWNLGNRLDAMKKDLGYTLDTEQLWGNPRTEKHMIDAVRAAGFDAIRIPVSYYNHIDASGIVDPAWLDRVEEVVNWSLENDLYTILNVHHDAGMDQNLVWIYADTDTFEQSHADYVNLWRQIAERFSTYDERLLFQSSGEWMNLERSQNGTHAEDFRIVHELNQAFIDTVRQSGGGNENRYLLLSPFAASAEEDILRAMFAKPFSDPAKNRLILSVHSYATDPTTLRKGAETLAAVSRDYNIPIVIDEFGVPVTVSPLRRFTATERFLSEAARRGIVCFHWDDGFEYKLLDPHTGKPAFAGVLRRMRAIARGAFPSPSPQS